MLLLALGLWTAGCGSSGGGGTTALDSSASAGSGGLGVRLRLASAAAPNPPTSLELSLSVLTSGGTTVAGVTDQTVVIGQTSAVSLTVPSDVPLTVNATALSGGVSYAGSAATEVNAGASQSVDITLTQQSTPSPSPSPAGTPVAGYVWDGGLDGGSSSQIFNYTQGSYLEGYEFTANQAITVTQLGYYDSNLGMLANGAETFVPVPVGLYDITTNSLLGSVMVQPGDTAAGVFRYHALSAPITLNTTDTYAVVAATITNFYVACLDPSVPLTPSDVNSAINYLAFAGFGPGGLTQTTSLVQPNYFPPNSLNYDLGANFIFQ